MTGTRGLVLAFAVLGAPVAWAAQLVGGYAVEEAACSTGAGQTPVLSLDAEPILWAISVAAFVVAILAGCLGAASWLRVRRAGTLVHRDRIAFLGAMGAIAAIVFLEAIVLSAIAIVPLGACAAS